MIHAPDESEETFFKRCHGAVKKDSSPPFKLAKTLFDINPDWVEIHFSNQGLHFWEGGCTWIQEDKVKIQLRKTLEKKSHYFGYHREEILAHELVHVVRGAFEEPIFEEILAYQASPSFFRRFLGPLFRSSKEGTFFLISLFALSLSTFFSVFQSVIFFSNLFLITTAIFRLLKAQYAFIKTEKRIEQIVGKTKALPVMIRLTDREIIRFSKMDKNQILFYAIKMSCHQLRWQQIYLSYFKLGFK